jgi:hypothetical protein
MALNPANCQAFAPGPFSRNGIRELKLILLDHFAMTLTGRSTRWAMAMRGR